MRIKALTLYAKILSFFLVLLGFQACDDPAVEYGSPSAKYKVKGSAVSETDEVPVKGIRAVLVQTYNGEENPYATDTVYTDNSGEFELEISGITDDNFLLKLQDIDGEQNGSFEDRELSVDFRGIKLEGGKGWYMGEAEKDMGKIALKSKTEE